MNCSMLLRYALFSLLNIFLQIILGKRVQRPAVMSKPLADEILKAQTDTTFKTTLGTTMCTDDFYEGIQ